jgi:crotonobetainyl-CoA:carnitine CoA-transferase CaiB-like acyl-CoA transferase
LARELRLLVAPVRRPVRGPRRLAVTPGLLDVSSTGPLRVVDWSTLWAGPWAAGRLAADGAEVDRIEHPARRDGYRLGSRAYRRFNLAKRLHLLDLATAEGHRSASWLMESADVVISGHTPRVLPGFGFDDDWLTACGPRLLVELVAYEPPCQDQPGLGEHGAAMAGLLWRPGRPYPALPWADPLLGAQALLAVGAWCAGGRPRGARVRLTLEGAARLAARPGSRKIWGGNR